MTMPRVTIDAAQQLCYSESDKGWYAQCSIVCPNGDTHYGNEYVPLGPDATEAEIKLALLRLYAPTGELPAE